MIIATYNTFMSNRGESVRTVHFGKALRFFRRRASLTQTELGDLIKVGQSTIAGWERQAEPVKDPFVISELARHLNTTADALENGQIPIPEIEELDALQDHIRKLAMYYGGPNADWKELEIVIMSISAIKDPAARRREIAYLQGLAARQTHQANEIGEDRADYTTDEKDAL